MTHAQRERENESEKKQAIPVAALKHRMQRALVLLVGDVYIRTMLEQELHHSCILSTAGEQERRVA
jgi:hypothetical protein